MYVFKNIFAIFTSRVVMTDPVEGDALTRMTWVMLMSCLSGPLQMVNQEIQIDQNQWQKRSTGEEPLGVYSYFVYFSLSKTQDFIIDDKIS